MTDNEIIKALEFCRRNERESTCQYCLKCFMSDCELEADEETCLDALYRRSSNLIKKQHEEIEHMKERERILIYHIAVERENAIKEFAEKLKERFFGKEYEYERMYIDNVAKEIMR